MPLETSTLQQLKFSKKKASPIFSKIIHQTKFSLPQFTLANQSIYFQKTFLKSP